MTENSAAAAPATVPPDFTLYARPVPSWGETLGPTYLKVNGPHNRIVGVRVAAAHLNIGAVAHGGMLTTLADSSLGINIALARAAKYAPSAQVTVSLTADFLSGARLGEWLEARVDVSRLGQRLAYANCGLWVGERQVLRASAVFAFVDRPLPPGRGLAAQEEA